MTDWPDELEPFVAEQMKDPVFKEAYEAAVAAEAARPPERTVTVTYGLPRYTVRQHLELNGIPFTEDKQIWESMFTVEADDAQWDGIQQAKKEAER